MDGREVQGFGGAGCQSEAHKKEIERRVKEGTGVQGCDQGREPAWGCTTVCQVLGNRPASTQLETSMVYTADSRTAKAAQKNLVSKQSN